MPLIFQPYQVTKKRKKEDLCYSGQSPPVSTLASSLGCTFSSDWHTASPTLPIPKRPGYRRRLHRQSQRVDRLQIIIIAIYLFGSKYNTLTSPVKCVSVASVLDSVEQPSLY